MLLMDRCDEDELLLLLLLIVVGLLILVEELAECTRSRLSRGGDVAVAVAAVDGGEVMIGTIVVSDLEVVIDGLEDARPEDVCGRDGCVDDEFVADDGCAEKDAGRAVAEVGRGAFGRGPGLQEKGEMDFWYTEQVMAGMVETVVVYAGAYNVR